MLTSIRIDALEDGALGLAIHAFHLLGKRREIFENEYERTAREFAAGVLGQLEAERTRRHKSPDKAAAALELVDLEETKAAVGVTARLLAAEKALRWSADLAKVFTQEALAGAAGFVRELAGEVAGAHGLDLDQLQAIADEQLAKQGMKPRG